MKINILGEDRSSRTLEIIGLAAWLPLVTTSGSGSQDHEKNGNKDGRRKGLHHHPPNPHQREVNSDGRGTCIAGHRHA